MPISSERKRPMNERLVISIVFLSLAVAVSVFSFLYISSASEELLVLADSVTADIKEGDTSSARELISLWQEHQRGFAIILKHSDADAIDRYFLLFADAISSGDRERMLIAVSDISSFMQVTAEGEKPKIENIF